jgi:hypothetical protein
MQRGVFVLVQYIPRPPNIIFTCVHKRTSATVKLVEACCSRLLSSWSRNVEKHHYGKTELLRKSEILITETKESKLIMIDTVTVILITVQHVQ